MIVCRIGQFVILFCHNLALKGSAAPVHITITDTQSKDAYNTLCIVASLWRMDCSPDFPVEGKRRHGRLPSRWEPLKAPAVSSHLGERVGAGLWLLTHLTVELHV